MRVSFDDNECIARFHRSIQTGSTTVTPKAKLFKVVGSIACSNMKINQTLCAAQLQHLLVLDDDKARRLLPIACS